MEVTPELMDHIKRKLESIEYGKVTISVDSNSLTADVSAEERERFKFARRRETFQERIEQK